MQTQWALIHWIFFFILQFGQNDRYSAISNFEYKSTIQPEKSILQKLSRQPPTSEHLELTLTDVALLKMCSLQGLIPCFCVSIEKHHV